MPGLRALFAMLIASALAFAAIGAVFSDERENRAIGVLRGPSPFSLTDLGGNPALSAGDDADAAFVADPFLIRGNGTWLMFFQVFDKGTGQDVFYP